MIGDLGRRKMQGLIEKFLAGVAASGCQNRWVNINRRAIARFSKWCWEQEYIDAQPVERVAVLRQTEDKPCHEGRAFTPAELESLAKGRYGLFYRFRALTGFRGQEAVRLLVGDLEWRDDALAIRVRPEVCKNRWAGILPLAPTIADELWAEVRMRVPGMRLPDSPLFPNAPRRRELQRSHFRADLATAGLDEKTEAGALYLGSFRKSFTTWLEAAGVKGDYVSMLRRDIGEGSKRLRTRTYADFEQLLPELRASLERAEKWYSRELERTNSAQSNGRKKSEVA